MTNQGLVIKQRNQSQQQLKKGLKNKQVNKPQNLHLTSSTTTKDSQNRQVDKSLKGQNFQGKIDKDQQVDYSTAPTHYKGNKSQQPLLFASTNQKSSIDVNAFPGVSTMSTVESNDFVQDITNNDLGRVIFDNGDFSLVVFYRDASDAKAPYIRLYEEDDFENLSILIEKPKIDYFVTLFRDGDRVVLTDQIDINPYNFQVYEIVYPPIDQFVTISPVGENDNAQSKQEQKQAQLEKVHIFQLLPYTENFDEELQNAYARNARARLQYKYYQKDNKKLSERLAQNFLSLKTKYKNITDTAVTRLVQFYFNSYFKHDNKKQILINGDTQFLIFRTNGQVKLEHYLSDDGRVYHIIAKNCKRVYENIVHMLDSQDTKTINVSEMFTIFFNTIGKKDEKFDYNSDVYIKVKES